MTITSCATLEIAKRRTHLHREWAIHSFSRWRTPIGCETQGLWPAPLRPLSVPQLLSADSLLLHTTPSCNLSSHQAIEGKCRPFQYWCNRFHTEAKMWDIQKHWPPVLYNPESVYCQCLTVWAPSLLKVSFCPYLGTGDRRKLCRLLHWVNFWSLPKQLRRLTCHFSVLHW